MSGEARRAHAALIKTAPRRPQHVCKFHDSDLVSAACQTMCSLFQTFPATLSSSTASHLDGAQRSSRGGRAHVWVLHRRVVVPVDDSCIGASSFAREHPDVILRHVRRLRRSRPVTERRLAARRALWPCASSRAGTAACGNLLGPGRAMDHKRSCTSNACMHLTATLWVRYQRSEFHLKTSMPRITR